MDIVTQRAKLESDIAELQRERGTVVLEGGDIGETTARLQRAQHQLDALVSAQGVEAGRQRQGAEELRLARIEELRAKLRDAYAEFLETQEKAEMHCRNLRDALVKISEHGRAINSLYHLITERRVPVGVGADDIERRTGRRLAAVLSDLRGKGPGGGIYGSLHFQAELAKPTDDWSAAEAHALDPTIKPLIGDNAHG